MAPKDPNEIDINLSLLPGESELAVNSLVAQLRAISAQLAVLQAPDSGAAAAAGLLAFQQTGIPSNRLSPTASVADPGNVGQAVAVSRAAQARETAREAEEERRRELAEIREKRIEAENLRQDRQGQIEADRATEQAKRDADRERQEKNLKERTRQQHATARAQDALDAAGPIRGLQYVATGRMDINKGLPDDQQPFSDREQSDAFEAIRPQGSGRVGRVVNRVLQAWHPDRQGVGNDEVLRQQASARAYAQVAHDEGETPMRVPPPTGAGKLSPAASRPPGAVVHRLGDDGVPESGMIPSGGAVPEGGAAWQAHVSREFAGQGFTMPRIGEFTAQDTLSMLAQTLGRGAYARQNAGGTGNTLGNSAAIFARMSNTAPIVSNLQTNLGRRGFDLSGENLERIAYLTGTATPGTLPVPGTGIRVINPLDVGVARAKGLYGLGRMAMDAGAQGAYLRTGQASELAGEMVNRGFDRNTIVGALRGPMSHLRGSTRAMMDPATLVDEWQQAFLAGGQSMDQFVQSMDGVVPAARAARMNVDEMNASISAHAEAVQQMGGTRVGGRIAAGEFSTMTGLPPQVLTQMMQDPLVQGLTYSQTGIMPQLQGMLPSSVQAQQGVGTINMLANMFQGGFSDQRIAVPGGHMTISARDQAVAMAGQQMGLDREATQRLLDRNDAMKTVAPVTSAYEAYQQDIENARNKFGSNSEAFRIARGQINRGRGASGVSRHDIARAMDRAGLDGAAILDKSGSDINNAIEGQESKKWAGIFDGDDGRAPNQTVEIRLKGAAAKYLEKVEGPGNQSQRARNSTHKEAADLLKSVNRIPEIFRDWGG